MSYIDPTGRSIAIPAQGFVVLALVGSVATYMVAKVALDIAMNSSKGSVTYRDDGESSAEDDSTVESCPSNDKANWEKIPGSNQAYRPKGGKEPVFEKDRGGDRSHGDSAWKKWDKARDWNSAEPRNGTYDKDGKRLRD